VPTIAKTRLGEQAFRRHPCPVSIPGELRRRFDGGSWSLAWDFNPGAETWRVQQPGGDVIFVKTSPAGQGLAGDRLAGEGLAGEAARMRWAGEHGLAVPRVIDVGRDDDTEWLVTAALTGQDATADELTADPRRLVRLLGAGLRAFHAAPAAQCPFRLGVEQAIADAAARAAADLVAADDLHPEHAHLTPQAAAAELRRLRPDKSCLVVCHGDYCLPNVLIDGWAVAGYVDLGALTVADRWRDLAVGSWSVTWNLGPGWEDEFFDSYGIKRDEQAIAFYRLLYDLEP
jgi:kanamycin kinase